MYACLFSLYANIRLLRWTHSLQLVQRGVSMYGMSPLVVAAGGGHRLVRGRGALADRVQALRDRYVIPHDKLMPVMQAAIIGAAVLMGSALATTAALRTGLATGRLHIAHLAADNVLAWRDGSPTTEPTPVSASG